MGAAAIAAGTMIGMSLGILVAVPVSWFLESSAAGAFLLGLALLLGLLSGFKVGEAYGRRQTRITPYRPGRSFYPFRFGPGGWLRISVFCLATVTVIGGTLTVIAGYGEPEVMVPLGAGAVLAMVWALCLRRPVGDLPSVDHEATDLLIRYGLVDHEEVTAACVGYRRVSVEMFTEIWIAAIVGDELILCGIADSGAIAMRRNFGEIAALGLHQGWDGSVAVVAFLHPKGPIWRAELRRHEGEEVPPLHFARLLVAEVDRWWSSQATCGREAPLFAMSCGDDVMSKGESSPS
ncbi:hypothetical protein L2U69_12265 [Zavarzinia compransoris]|uniref:hypothetical protein n=1 Tax=Zavarzinia marina TaxID=2911065 RepID=UPI001F43D695|nr:hypothetical protein [Zavarzinia marina]MCF4166419.1 hypothetical protein [Zavarzinia marina]